MDFRSRLELDENFICILRNDTYKILEVSGLQIAVGFDYCTSFGLMPGLMGPGAHKVRMATSNKVLREKMIFEESNKWELCSQSLVTNYA